MQLPPPPACSFASDNSAGAHPAVLEAVLAANRGHAVAYGADDWTRRCEGAFGELFGADVMTLLTFNGTGANILALSALLRPADAVICTAGAHIAVDETGAAERILGCKLLDVPATDGKLTPEHLDAHVHLLGNPHHVQPGVVSITQSTELGTVYTVDEVGALCDTAHRLGMSVHMDGARIANATAALGGGVTTLRAFTREAGVDVVTFGGTKNGLLGAEAVIFLRPVERAQYLRKQVNQLASKMRFLSAQFLALLDGDLWLELATHANAMCTELHGATAHLPHVEMAPPEVNSVFPVLPSDVIASLQAWSFFWDWEPSRRQVRWMTAWDTSSEDVRAFAAGVTRATEAALDEN